ncbi:bifunctional [glutamine synthetase] adenylyltransferase/[glutamine synthetase]-adenylyl-L-tyrosine phosphorylase [Parasphingopyxis marina]|uniref:Bifunctional [glutamine synthetase] adenylyltransferase/[glutamine synthetase]-adenylyl-L-tyrosine phosphorylase n=1 Tax=Parasphingopyxis marina TaxID=2761622 RepID=A0A842HX42_9SPHN|nr:bifunctional [glutamine synthetase] adenylyltransferase/[glutamine synthetase]-adenylyl-L-tyrosine phosphorylase [Parasphingopyxis marina]MBC2776987.1 bifunctional [glutamine synthetase] adenylyltransferase/[glutamine synthetase]-adenylyl-L-tyrosine phosphorylase [Parasphingopyxis marina]
MTRPDPQTALAGAIARIRQHSPFLRRIAEGQAETLDSMVKGEFSPSLSAFRSRFGEEEGAIPVRLRHERQKLALYAGLGDLAGLFSFEDVVALLSDFADHALERAIEDAFAECLPGEAVAGFTAIALGKHGSRELNYSSDIDIIFLFDPDTLPRRGGTEPQKTAVRIGRHVVDTLQERTGEGYVLRVDLRLRPSPEATPIALPVNAAISHYEANAEAWERAVFIRGRPVGGDTALGAMFLEAIRPFVWRRSLDFGAVRDIRAISRRIRGHYAQGQAFGPGYDLKRGRGGIREIEFYAQIPQLIHGGREPQLRAPATLDALRALGEAGWIAARDVETLGKHYRLFRTIEHRLQMVEDQQTHSLPSAEPALHNVAQLHGLGDGEALLGLLAGPVEFVGALYDELDEDDEERLPADAERLEKALDDAGFTAAGEARRRIEGWREGKVRTTRTAVAREALETVLPALVAEFGRAPDPAGALNRFDVLLDRLPSAVNLFRMLEARPGLARLLVDVLSHSPALADELARRAELFDGLIDATALDPPEPLGELIAIFESRSASPDYQLRLDRMRAIVGEERFALGVQLIEGIADPLDVAAGYARVAEAALTVLADAAIAEFEETHGTMPGGELVILALGRLGGEALTHASDLDLVYLFTGEHGAESVGKRSLGATVYFQRLAQRVTAALSAPTAAGPLYEVDTRLRPSGAQGLLAVSFDSFETYHRDSAWTWEHMALARARPVYGSPQAREKLVAMIATILRRERDPEKLAADVRAMRAEITEHKVPAGSLDVKLVPGGLVDLEFCVHLLQLRERIGLDPHLPRAVADLVAGSVLAPGVAAANELLTRMLVTLRLVAPASKEVAAASRPLVAQCCRADNWETLLADYEAARQCVAGEWRRLALTDEE